MEADRTSTMERKLYSSAQIVRALDDLIFHLQGVNPPKHTATIIKDYNTGYEDGYDAGYDDAIALAMENIEKLRRRVVDGKLDTDGHHSIW